MLEKTYKSSYNHHLSIMTEANRSMDRKINPTAIDVRAYIGDPENSRNVQYGRICGDGRYWPEESGGRLARFGADMGYVMGLLALNKSQELNLSPEEIVDAVITASTKDGGKFSLHTDTNGKCGHTYNATLPENEHKYGLNSQEMKKALDYATSLSQFQPDKVEMVTLEGQHKEKGVIFNTGKKKKINHRQDDQQWFVVSARRDNDYVQNVLFPQLLHLLPVLGEKNISAEEYLEILRQQTNATAEILAKGLPIYEVDMDSPIPVVMPAGVV